MKEKNNGFKQAMQKVEQDFRTNSLEKTLERLGINPDCLSESFKEELKGQPEDSETVCPRTGVIIGPVGAVVGVGTSCPIGVVEGKVPSEGKTHYGSGVVLGDFGVAVPEHDKDQELKMQCSFLGLGIYAFGSKKEKDVEVDEEGQPAGRYFGGPLGPQIGYMAGILSDECLKDDIDSDDFKLTKEENDFLDSIEPPEDLF